MRCHSLRSSCFIDPFGVVYPCITYTRPLGSLRETAMDLGAIWRTAATANTQREIWDGQCPQCWTACEAYQSILGNAGRVWDRAARPQGRNSAAPGATIPVAGVKDASRS
jgi:radical SAM protein with 4Fe4S-binding SPASM domain